MTIPLPSRSRPQPGIALWVVALASACATGGHGSFRTTGDLDEEVRRAPGVALDPPQRLPPPRSSGDTAEALLVLQTPPDTNAAKHVVRAFFKAIASESESDLEAVLSDPAWSRPRSGSPRKPVVELWADRFSRLDYEKAPPAYRPHETTAYRASDLGAGTRLPIHVGGDDVVVHVPVASPTVGRTRFFGDELWFLLKLGPNGYTISQIVEDFQLP